MARWVIHEEELAKVDTVEVRKKIADLVAEDAKANVTKGTGRTAEQIHVAVDGDEVTVVADAARAQKHGEEHYDAYLELGTAEHGAAQPFLQPALYKYRSP